MIQNESSYTLNEQNIRKSKLNDSIRKILDERCQCQQSCHTTFDEYRVTLT